MTESKNDALLGKIVRMSFAGDDGPCIAIQEWGIDCDHSEATKVFTIYPLGDLWDGQTIFWWSTNLLKQLLDLEEIMQECREGPCSMTIISEQEYKEFEPYRRDHLAEAAGY